MYVYLFLGHPTLFLLSSPDVFFLLYRLGIYPYHELMKGFTTALSDLHSHHVVNYSQVRTAGERNTMIALMDSLMDALIDTLIETLDDAATTINVIQISAF